MRKRTMLITLISLITLIALSLTSRPAPPTRAQQASPGQLDLVFVIDTTSSMSDDIAAVRRAMADIIDRLAASGLDWRIGIVTYRDQPIAPYGETGDYIARSELAFSSDPAQIIDITQRINVGGGGDYPETVFSGLQLAIQAPWRTAAHRAIILMGDAPPHDPEPQSGLNLDRTLQMAYQAGQVSIYSLLVNNETDTRLAFQRLSDGSSGRLFTSLTAEAVVDTIFTTLNSITEDVELAGMMQPGTTAEVVTAKGETLALHEGPGTAFATLDSVENGERVTILAGPSYAESRLWWRVRSPRGVEGWVVEAVAGIRSVSPLEDERPILFVERFYDNAYSWETSTGDYLVTSVIRDGLYTVVADITDEFEYWVVAPGFYDWSVAPIFNQPYEVEFSILDAQSTGAGPGIVVLLDVNQNYEPYKRLIINDNGTWQLFRWTGTRELLAQGNLVGGPINFADRRLHTLKLQVGNDAYVLFIDGQEVARMPNFDRINGTVGFGVARGSARTGDRVVVRFDDLLVRSLGN